MSATTRWPSSPQARTGRGLSSAISAESTQQSIRIVRGLAPVSPLGWRSFEGVRVFTGVLIGLDAPSRRVRKFGGGVSL